MFFMPYKYNIINIIKKYVKSIHTQLLGTRLGLNAETGITYQNNYQQQGLFVLYFDDTKD